MFTPRASRILLLTTLAVVLTAIPAAGQSGEFNFTTLSPQWFWVRENTSRWSLTERPGHMRMYTDGALWKNLSSASLLLQKTSGLSLAISTRVAISPSCAYQQGGLLVYQDDDNYVKVMRFYHPAGHGIEMCYERGGNPITYQLPCSSNTVFLRINKQGNDYTGLYSLNGVDFLSIRTVKVDIGANLKAGLFAEEICYNILWDGCLHQTCY